MEIHIFEKQTVINNFIAQLRNINVQGDKMRFRTNLEKVGELMAYEVSKKLEYEIINITTPLGNIDIDHVTSNLVLTTILRAGLPMHQGVQNIFNNAENSYISAYRKYDENKNIKIKFEYISGPSYKNKTVILSDPMLATGSSIVTCYNALKERGMPKHTHILCIIGSKTGVKYVKNNIKDKNVTLWIAAIDPILNNNGYIVPGLGDAGDLALGEKI